VSAETRGPVIERVGLVAVTVQVQQECDGEWIARIPRFGITGPIRPSELEAVHACCRAASYPNSLPDDLLP
jgi:hypothetical protein